MPRSQIRQEKQEKKVPMVVPDGPRARYLVLRREDVWFIHFNDKEFGPYKTEREAKLFAIDAAQKFGEQGEKTQVLGTDETGRTRPVWTYGHDPYPPKL